MSAWIDALIVSGEEGVDKPDPAIFAGACARLGVERSRAVHVGDDPTADYAGAIAAGCAALLFGRDVPNFKALARRLAP